MLERTTTRRPTTGVGRALRWFRCGASVSSLAALAACTSGEHTPVSFANDRCEGVWWLLVPTTLRQGQSAVAEVTKFSTQLAQASECDSRITSIRVTASVPGIVGIKPGDAPQRAVVTAENLGDTVLTAEISLKDGSTRSSDQSSVKVVP